MRVSVVRFVLRSVICIVAAVIALVASIALAPSFWVETLCAASVRNCLVHLIESRSDAEVKVTRGEARVEGWLATRTILPSLRLRLSSIEVAFGAGNATVLRAADLPVTIALQWTGLALVAEMHNAEFGAKSEFRTDRLDAALLWPSRVVKLEGTFSVKGILLKVSNRRGSGPCGGASEMGGVLALRDAADKEISSLSYTGLDGRLRPYGTVCLDAAAPAELAGMVAAATGEPLPMLSNLVEPLHTRGKVSWPGPSDSNFAVEGWVVEVGNCRSEGTLTRLSSPEAKLHVAMRRLDLECMELHLAAKKRRWRDPVPLNTQCEPLRAAHRFLIQELLSARLLLTIEKLEWREKALRKVEVEFAPIKDARQVAVRATLPDDANFTLELSHQRGDPSQLTGRVLAIEPALQQTLAWLKLDDSKSPVDRVSKANLSAVMTWRERHLAIRSETLHLSDDKGESLLPDAYIHLSVDCKIDGEALVEARLGASSIDVLRLAPSGAVKLSETLAENPRTRLQGLRVDLNASIKDGEPSQGKDEKTSLVRITAANVSADAVDLHLKATSTGDNAAPARGAAWIARLHSWIQENVTPTNLEAISKLKGPLEEFLSAAVFRQIEFDKPLAISATKLRLHVGRTSLADVGNLSAELKIGADKEHADDREKGLRIAAKTSLSDSHVGTLSIAHAKLDVGLIFGGPSDSRTLKTLTIDETNLAGDAIDRIWPGMLPGETAQGGVERRVSFAFRGNLHADVVESEARTKIAELKFGDLVSLQNVNARLEWKNRTFALSATNQPIGMPQVIGRRPEPECVLARPPIVGPTPLRINLALSSGPSALLRELRFDAKVGRSGAVIDTFELQAGSRTGLRSHFSVTAPTAQGETTIGGCFGASLDPKADLKAAAEAFPDLVSEEVRRLARTNDQPLSLEIVGGLKGSADQIGGPVLFTATVGRASEAARPQAVLPTGRARLATHLVLDQWENLQLAPLRRGPAPPANAALFERLARTPSTAQVAGQNCRRAPCTMHVELGDLQVKLNFADATRPDLRIGRLSFSEAQSGERLELQAPAGRDVVTFGQTVTPPGDGRHPVLTVAIEALQGTDVRLLRRLKTPIEQLLPAGNGNTGRFGTRIFVGHLASWDAIAEWFGLSTSVRTHGAGIRDFDLTYEAGRSTEPRESFAIKGTVLNGDAAAVARSSCAEPAGSGLRFGRLKDGTIDLSGSIEKIGRTRTGSAILAVAAAGTLHCIGAVPAWNLFLGRSSRPRPIDLLAGHLDVLRYRGKFQLGGESPTSHATSLLYLPGHDAKLEAEGEIALKLYDLLDFSAYIYSFYPEAGMRLRADATVRGDSMKMSFWHDDPRLEWAEPSANVRRLPRRLAGTVDWRLSTRTGTVTAMARSDEWLNESIRQCGGLNIPRYVERVVMQCRENPAGCPDSKWKRPTEKFDICNLLTHHPDLAR